MRLTKTKNLLTNILYGIPYKVLTLLLPFAIRTIIIKQLGTEYLGISSLFSSIFQAMSLAELGIGSALVFNMYKYIAENNQQKLCAYMNFYKKCYRIIGCIILTAGIILLPFLKNIIHGSYPEDVNIYLVYIIYLTNTVLSYWLFAYKNSIALAYQRTDIESKALAVTQTGLSIMQIILLITFKNYYTYVILIPAATLIKNLIVSAAIDKTFPEITAAGSLSAEERNGIYRDVKSLFGHQIAFTVINSADNIFLSAILGLKELTIYNNYYYIFNAIMSFLVIYFHGIQAGIGNDIIVNKENAFTNFKRFRLATFLIIEMCGAFLFTLTQPFMEIWMGKQLMFGDGAVVVFLIGFLVTQCRKVVTTYKNAAGIWKDDFWKPYIVIGTDVLLDVFLIRMFGSIGAMLSTIFSMGLVAVPWETIVFYRRQFNSKATEHFMFAFKQLTVYALSIAMLYLIMKSISLSGFGGLLLKLIITGTFEAIVLFACNYKSDEFKWALSKAKAMITA